MPTQLGIPSISTSQQEHFTAHSSEHRQCGMPSLHISFRLNNRGNDQLRESGVKQVSSSQGSLALGNVDSPIVGCDNPSFEFQVPNFLPGRGMPWSLNSRLTH